MLTAPKLDTIAMTLAVAAPVTPPAFSLPEWGMLGAMFYLCAQKGWQWFNGKEAAEAALLNKLIDGMSMSQTQMLQQMVANSDRTHQDIKELKDAAVRVIQLVDERDKDRDRELAEVRASLSRIERELSAR